MLQSLKIVNKYYWKSLFGPGVMFVFSVLFTLVTVEMWDLASLIQPFLVLPNIFSGVSMIVGMFCIPMTINSLRTSMIMKRLDSSKITVLQFAFTFIIYYFVMTLIAYMWFIAFGFAIFANKVDDYINVLKMIDVACLFYAVLISFLLSLSLGFLVLMLTKRNYVIGLVAALVFLIGFFLSPFFAPIQMVHELLPYHNHLTQLVQMRPTSLYYAVYIDPFWYTTSMSYEAFFSSANGVYNFLGSNIFNPSQDLRSYFMGSNSLHVELTQTDKWLNLMVPPAIITILLGIESKYLKWNVR